MYTHTNWAGFYLSMWAYWAGSNWAFIGLIQIGITALFRQWMDTPILAVVWKIVYELVSEQKSEEHIKCYNLCHNNHHSRLWVVKKK